MHDVPAVFRALKNPLFSGDEWIWLYELAAPNGGPLVTPDGQSVVVRVTSRRIPVQWGLSAAGLPLTWDPWPVTFESLDESSDNTLPEVRIAFANVHASVAALWDANDQFRGHRLTIRLVNAKALDDPSAVLAIKTTVVDSSMTWPQISLRCSDFAVLDFSHQNIIGRRCKHPYRGARCGFTGDAGDVTLGSCAHDLEACNQRGAYELANGLPVLHPFNFGGYLGLQLGAVA